MPRRFPLRTPAPPRGSAGRSRGGRKRLVFGAIEMVRRAEHRQRGVTLELVHKPVVAVDLLDDHREEPVQQVDHLGRGPAGDQLRGADDVDEDHGDLAFLAAQLGALLVPRPRPPHDRHDGRTDPARVRAPRSPSTIELKPRCSSPSSVPSNTTTLQSRSPCSTWLSAARTTRTGVAVSHDTIHIRMKPKSSANERENHNGDGELRLGQVLQ